MASFRESLFIRLPPVFLFLQIIIDAFAGDFRVADSQIAGLLGERRRAPIGNVIALLTQIQIAPDKTEDKIRVKLRAYLNQDVNGTAAVNIHLRWRPG